jgi:hypothetical protein
MAAFKIELHTPPDFQGGELFVRYGPFAFRSIFGTEFQQGMISQSLWDMGVLLSDGKVFPTRWITIAQKPPLITGREDLLILVLNDPKFSSDQ